MPEEKTFRKRVSFKESDWHKLTAWEKSTGISQSKLISMGLDALGKVGGDTIADEIEQEAKARAAQYRNIGKDSK